MLSPLRRKGGKKVPKYQFLMQKGHLLKANEHKRIKANYYHFDAPQTGKSSEYQETAEEHSYITETTGETHKTVSLAG